MKAIFDSISLKCSKLTTKTYSTSFSLGILFLDKNIRNDIYSIYGFVRFADEIVDSFEGYDKAYLLETFKNDTFKAIENKISLNPIINSFQGVVNSHNIDLKLISQFLKSMEMDLQKTSYNLDNYKEYILGSAEVVGLMCLQVFSKGNAEVYESLKPYAMKLGAAFQKINFLRDLKADYEELGRTYFPGIKISEFSSTEKTAIEAEIEKDFKEALIGIRKLPSGSKKGVYLAYVYYYSLFKKIKKVPASKLISKRIRISNLKKCLLMINSFFQYKFNLI